VTGVLRTVVVLVAVLFADAGPSYVTEVVDGWRSSPVYVDPAARSLVPDAEAARLARRVDTQDPPVRIAVLPAEALGPGAREARARAFVDAVVDRAAADGIYLVVFGDAFAWGSAVGTDAPVASVLAGEQGSQPVALLDAVLTRLGVPSSAGEDSRRWVAPVLVGLLAVVAVACGYGWWRARRRYGRSG
jgi:hypothetical protein